MIKQIFVFLNLTSSSGTSSRTSRNLSPDVVDEIGVPCVVDVVVV
jgi:hypothetical protein